MAENQEYYGETDHIENPSLLNKAGGTNSQETKGDVLMLNDEWGTSKGGISSVHRCIAAQVKSAGYGVHATAFTATKDDMDDAKERGVNLILAENETSNPPNFDWLNFYDKVHFPTLESEAPNVKVIIGHVPITSEAALQIREKRFPKAKVFLFNHIIPQATDRHKGSWDIGKTENKMEDIMKQAEKADAIFSVGPMIFEWFASEFRASDHINHIEFLPLPDDEFFEVDIKEPNPELTPQILTVGRVAKVEYLKGYDVIANAISCVAEVFTDAKGIKVPRWRVRGIPNDMQELSVKFFDDNVKSPHIDIIPLLYGTQEDIRKDMKKSHIFVMPSRCEPFGMVAMEAMAAGLPTLVTSNSGFADFLKSKFKSEYKSLVVEVGVRDCPSNVEAWKKNIITILRDYQTHFDKAKDLSKKLKDSPAIKESLDDFKKMLE